MMVRHFLQAMINAEERPKVSSIMASPAGTAGIDGKGEES
jgi:hypothetical protein